MMTGSGSSTAGLVGVHDITHPDGQQIFHGSVDGKTGSFAARDYGYIRDGHLEGTWEIIPETGT